MNKIDYFVLASGIIERGMFYNYLHDKGYKDINYNREEMINSSYPFGICLKKKEVMIIESATLCYLNQKSGRNITVEKFKEMIENEG